MSHAPLSLAEGLALSAYIDARDGTRPPGVLRCQQRVHLAWPSTRRRWSLWTAPCVRCGEQTHSRDGEGMPVHPGCVEADLTDRFTQEWRTW